jgi:hypothetical protein
VSAAPAGKNGKDGATVQAPATETPTSGEFADGTYKVGVDIQPGEYKGTVSDGNGYWAAWTATRRSSTTSGRPRRARACTSG